MDSLSINLPIAELIKLINDDSKQVTEFDVTFDNHIFKFKYYYSNDDNPDDTHADMPSFVCKQVIFENISCEMFITINFYKNSVCTNAYIGSIENIKDCKFSGIKCIYKMCLLLLKLMNIKHIILVDVSKFGTQKTKTVFLNALIGKKRIYVTSFAQMRFANINYNEYYGDIGNIEYDTTNIDTNKTQYEMDLEFIKNNLSDIILFVKNYFLAIGKNVSQFETLQIGSQDTITKFAPLLQQYYGDHLTISIDEYNKDNTNENDRKIFKIIKNVFMHNILFIKSDDINIAEITNSCVAKSQNGGNKYIHKCNLLFNRLLYLF